MQNRRGGPRAESEFDGQCSRVYVISANIARDTDANHALGRRLRFRAALDHETLRCCCANRLRRVVGVIRDGAAGVLGGRGGSAQRLHASLAEAALRVRGSVDTFTRMHYEITEPGSGKGEVKGFVIRSKPRDIRDSLSGSDRGLLVEQESGE